MPLFSKRTVLTQCNAYNRRMRANLILQLVTATVYAVVAWISLLVVAPTGYVAPVYPPAGIALGAVILYGYRIWPAILVGALIANGASTLNAGGVLGPALIVSGCGAALQAVLGGWLARRLIDFPTALDTPRSIARLLFVVAPLSSIVNATLSIPALVASGTLAADESIGSWGIWWLGDTLGALVALPLMFVFLAEPKEVWRPRRMAVTVPLLIVAILTAIVFERLQRAETLRIEGQFERETAHVAALIENRLTAQLDALIAIERFTALNERFSRDEFRAFVTPLLERHTGTQNFSWNPLVADATRTRFEEAISTGDLPGYRILDRVDSTPPRTQPAMTRREYLPILYVEPITINTSVIGLDPLSIPRALPAIRATRQSGTPVATESFTLIQEQASQRGVVIYLAAFHHPPWDDGTRELKGLVSSAFRMDDALGSTLSQLHARNMLLCLVDIDAPAGNSRLSGPEGCEHASWMERPLAHRYAQPFAERTWEIRLVSATSYADEMRTLTAWWSIVTGVVAAGLLAAFLLMTSGHARRVERLVVQRTRELAAATEGLRAQRTALARAQQIARMGSWELDTDTGALECSDGLRELLALPSGKISYTALLEAIAESDRPRLDRTVSTVRNGGAGMTVDCHPAGSPGTTLQFVVECENLGKPEERVIGTAQDVTLARQAEADIQQLAHYDSLTGLPNRMLWSIRAQAAMQGARRHEDTLAVLFLDLDHFKTVNDSLGHRIGDALLQAVATRLSECLREEDFLARLGGDEFVALLPRLTDGNDAATVAQKMLASMRDPVELGGHQLQPSISIGIALFPQDGGDVDTLLKHADTAMYGAKNAGRNTLRHFVEAMNTQALERLTIENGLRRAIERDELVLHYQPQFDAVHEQVTGIEALVRWNSAELGGLIPPDRFIPIAEDSGIIIPLGEWVLRRACMLQESWQGGRHAKLLIAVNISAVQFNAADFVDKVSTILRETGADPLRIELEITESAIMGQGVETVERLNQLRALGLTLALDDFGTGYSSLGRLHRLPITRLKLDRSFVQHLPGDPDNAAIANAALSMARALKIEVVAEGIETEAQKAYLFARGCRLMQGYLYSRPLPLAELEHFFDGLDTGTEEADAAMR